MVNNLTEGGATAALSAEMGKRLEEEIQTNTLTIEHHNVTEDGIFFVDTFLNVGAKINSDGLFAINMITTDDI